MQLQKNTFELLGHTIDQNYNCMRCDSVLNKDVTNRIYSSLLQRLSNI